MSSNQNLKAGLAALIGGTVEDVDTLAEAAKIAAAKYIPILREAQRRIEALEGERDYFRDAFAECADQNSRLMQREADTFKALEGEVARLRVALQEIADHATSDEDDESISYSDCGADDLIEMARKAIHAAAGEE